MNPLRSVGARLSLALVIVVTLALLLVYLVVVPSLRSRLVDAKLNRMRNAMPTIVAGIPNAEEDQAGFDWVGNLETWSEKADGARVSVYTIVVPARGKRHTSLSSYRDSKQTATSNDFHLDDRVAVKAADTSSRTAGTVRRGNTEFAEVAEPAGQYIVLLSASLHDPLANVHTVQRRLVEAGILAILLALAIGYGASFLFARRIRRLEAAAERARREFIGNASHELRTPLFSLRGFLELLTDEELDEATRAEFLETMREQVDRLQRLAEDLLDLTRLDAGRMHIERQRIDLSELAGDLCDEFRAVAVATGHPLELDAGQASVFADEGRVVRIGRALLENALVHTPSGTRVVVRARGNMLVIADEGPGIPNEQISNVFDRFYRVDGAKASGSGLGLAIAKELAEAMGGTLTAASAPGETTFTLELPAAPLPSATPRLREPDEAPTLGGRA